MHGHLMHTPQNRQPPTKKEYRSMSFAANDPKFLIMIDNFTSYDEQNFWSQVRNLWVR